MASPSKPSRPADHYFAPDGADVDPDAPLDAARRTLTVRLRGHEVSVVTAAGVFSGERVDLGTSVLLREAPAPPTSGALLDLGCGWGPITLALAHEAPEAEVWAVDVTRRARELTAENARRAGASRVRTAAPQNVPADVRFAAIWSNPPIRVGKAVLHDMLLTWLPRLEPGASAHLVVQRHLGADSLQQWLIDELPAVMGDDVEVVRAGSAKGFRVLRVTAGAAPA